MDLKECFGTTLLANGVNARIPKISQKSRQIELHSRADVEPISVIIQKIIFNSPSMSVFLVRDCRCHSSQMIEMKIIDYHSLLEYVKPFDSLRVTVEPTEDVSPPNHWIKGAKNIQTFKLLDLIEFHRPFSSEQLYNVLGSVKGFGKRTLETLTGELDLVKLGTLVANGNWSEVENRLLNSRLGLEQSGKVMQCFKKMAGDVKHFTYLYVTNFLKRYQKCHLDDAKWQQCRKLMAKLLQNGISGPELVTGLSTYPYQYLLEGWTSATLTKFQIFDAIAKHGPYGVEEPRQFQMLDEHRQGAGLLTSLMERVYETGDCFVTEEVLEQTGRRVLGELDRTRLSKIPRATRYQLGSRRIIFPDNLDSCERAIVNYFANYNFSRPYQITRESILEIDPGLDEQQCKTVLDILQSGLGVITGPPGVGKTRVISAIHNWLSVQGESLILSAPTGMACKNISKTVETPVMTVAKLLYRGREKESDDSECDSNDDCLSHSGDSDSAIGGLRGPTPTVGLTVGSSDASYQVSGGDKIGSCILADLVNKTGGLIVDEVSMLDLSQFYYMIKELPEQNFRLILVGDPDQLPSIGPGKVLKDMIEGNYLPVYRLETNYRQKKALEMGQIVDIDASKMPKILENAKKIIGGVTELEPGIDFKIGRTHSDEQTLEIAVQLLERIGAKDFMDDLIILSPYSNKQFLATRNINKSFKSYFNPNPEVSWGPFSVNDRVMQMTNDYAKGIVNGDIGVIRQIKLKGNNDRQLDSLLVEYPSGNESVKQIKYSAHTSREQLTLAYAVSIHKSQGNGYKYVLVLIPQYYNSQFFNRNMLYTAVTRAKECVYLLGGNYDRAIETAHRDRATRLAFRMRTRKELDLKRTLNIEERSSLITN